MAGWVARLMAAVDANKPQPLFMTLSTIGLDGSPRARTVVCRRVVEDGRLVICTANDSDKWAELRRDGRFEICWYFGTTREQFRFRGSKSEFFFRPSEEADWVWNTMSEPARAMFINATNKSTDTFGVLSFQPQHVQVLELTSGVITTWPSH